MKKDGIPHYFHTLNAQRSTPTLRETIQEEFIDNNLDIIYDKPLFHQRPADFMIFYNTQRPHKALGLKSPMDYLIENKGMSQMSLTYTGS